MSDYRDAGDAQMDVSDPSHPVFVSDTRYSGEDPAPASSRHLALRGTERFAGGGLVARAPPDAGMARRRPTQSLSLRRGSTSCETAAC